MKGLVPDPRFHNDWRSYGEAVRQYLSQPVSDPRPIRPPSYTVAEVPKAIEDGLVIHVSNEVGGATLAYSQSGLWLRVRDDVEVS